MDDVRLPLENFTTTTIVGRRKCTRLLYIQVLTPSSGLLDFAISMRPDYHRAIIDTVRYYGWKKIIYLYDSHDGKSFTLRLSHAFLILQRVAARLRRIPLAAARAFSPSPLRYFSFYYICQVGSVSRGQLCRYRRHGISSGFPDFCAE